MSAVMRSLRFETVPRLCAPEKREKTTYIFGTLLQNKGCKLLPRLNKLRGEENNNENFDYSRTEP